MSDVETSEAEAPLVCVICTKPMHTDNTDELRNHIDKAHMCVYRCVACGDQLECDGEYVFGTCCAQYSPDQIVITRGAPAVVDNLVTMFTVHSLYAAAGRLSEVTGHLERIMLQHNGADEDNETGYSSESSHGSDRE